MNNLLNSSFEFSYAGLFSIDTQWRHPARTEKTYEIICVTRGQVHIREDNTEYTVKRGQVLLLSPHVFHCGTKTSSNVDFYWVHFRVKDGELPFQKRFFEEFQSIYLFKELLHYNNLPRIPEYLVNAVLVYLLSQLCHLSEETADDYNSLAETMYEWIRINASAKLKVARVAEEFGYCADHISRICKKHYGVGARELINRFLLARAKDLLCNTNQYIKEIAAELQFGDDKAFIGYFKYHEGCFPLEFRNRFGKIHMNRK